MPSRSRGPAPSAPDFRRRLRAELPRLLRDDADLRREILDVLKEVFPTRVEMDALRALREDFNRFATDMAQRFEAMDRRFEAIDRRFEAIDRRFEAIDRRFEAIIAELRRQQLHLSSLSGRLGHGFEHVIRGVVEEFAGRPVTRAERLVLRDDEGEVFGVPADIEFDLLASNGEVYLCEVKSHVKPQDVLTFHRKSTFAAKHIERPFTRLIIAPSMDMRAERVMTSLGIRYIVRARIDPDRPAGTAE